MRLAIALIALVLAAPAAAEVDPTIACFDQKASSQTREGFVTGMLSQQPFAQQPEDLRNEVTRISMACLFEHGIEQAQSKDYITSSLGFMAAEQLKRQLLALGYDMAPAETLLQRLESAPDLDIEKYIDDRPAEFEEPVTQLAQKLGVDKDEILTMMGGYIASRLQQNRFQPGATAP